jgi:hypothetical protein
MHEAQPALHMRLGREVLTSLARNLESKADRRNHACVRWSPPVGMCGVVGRSSSELAVELESCERALVLGKAVRMVDNLDADKTHILSSLTQVGPAKPIGYLPLYTIRDILRIEPNALACDAEARGLSTAPLGPDQCCIKSGALYVFDRKSLEHMMQSSRHILSPSRWPLDPEQFVARIAREWIDQAHPVVPVIRRAFGDPAV